MKISKKELNQIYFRSYGLEWDWNYERQQNLAFGYCMIPVIEKLYSDPDDRILAMQRHLEFFNTTPHLATLILGISAAMEEENSSNKEFDTNSINNVKISLMGPLAGVGDSFIWGTLRIIATGVGISLANQGNILGPILFLLIFNIPAQGLRYYLLHWGYKFGSDFLLKFKNSVLMQQITYGAAVLGLIVVGAMTAGNVSLNIPLAIGSGDSITTISDICNGIMPGLLPFSFTIFMYVLVKKNVNTTNLLLLCAAIGLIGSFFGILG